MDRGLPDDRTVTTAIDLATRAPSVHNTQPWRFVVRDGGLDIMADWSRRLTVLDPRGRQLLMSCGCAVLNARVAMAAAGHGVIVERFGDPTRPDLIARIAPSGSSTTRCTRLWTGSLTKRLAAK